MNCHHSHHDDPMEIEEQLSVISTTNGSVNHMELFNDADLSFDNDQRETRDEPCHEEEEETCFFCHYDNDDLNQEQEQDISDLTSSTITTTTGRDSRDDDDDDRSSTSDQNTTNNNVNNNNTIVSNNDLSSSMEEEGEEYDKQQQQQQQQTEASWEVTNKATLATTSTTRLFPSEQEGAPFYHSQDHHHCNSKSILAQIPRGAQEIVQTLAAQEILHQMLQHKWRPQGNQQLEVDAILDLIQRFPSTCQVRYDMHMGYGKSQTPSPQRGQTTTTAQEDDSENTDGGPDDEMVVEQQEPPAHQQQRTKPHNHHQQTFEVCVPDSVQGGQSFDVLAGGVRVRVMCPIQALPGQRIRFRLPTHKQTVSLLPLSIIVCLNPPIKLVKAIFRAYPQAIHDTSMSTEAALACSTTNVNNTQKDGLRALDFACQFKASLEVIDFLHQQDPTAVTQSCTTDQALPLHRACSRHVDDQGLTVHYLLDQYPLAARQRGFPSQVRPLHLALEAGAPLSVIKRLIQYCPESLQWDNPHREGVDPTMSSSSSSSPLHLACRYRSNAAETVQYLCRVAPDLMELPDAYGYTPIFLAAKYQTVDVLQCLLPYARYVGMDGGGPTLLHFAARYNTPEVVEYLANACPWMVTAREEDRGRTPLFMACSSKLGHAISTSSSSPNNSVSAANPYLEIIRILLQKNPKSLWMKNKNQQTPLDIALKIHHRQQSQRHQRLQDRSIDMIRGDASSSMQGDYTTTVGGSANPIVQLLHEEMQRQEQEQRQQPVLSNRKRRNAATAAGFGIVRMSRFRNQSQRHRRRDPMDP